MGARRRALVLSPSQVAAAIEVSVPTARTLFRAHGATLVGARCLRLPVERLNEMLGDELAALVRARLVERDTKVRGRR